MHYSREIPQNYLFFPFFEPLIPQTNGLPLTPDIFGRKKFNHQQVSRKTPGATSPLQNLKAKHLSKAARFATRPAGPVIDLDRPGTQERNKRGPLKCRGFWGLDVG